MEKIQAKLKSLISNPKTFSIHWAKN